MKVAYIILCVLLLVVGFFLGRSGKEIRYVKGETVIDTIYSEKLVPYNVEIPAKPILPLKPDTIRINEKEIITLKVDTIQIIANYIRKNSYRTLLFNDNNGKMVVNSEVQYNSLSKLSYEFTPIQRESLRKDLFTPYITTSCNSFGLVGIGGGVYYHDVGLGIKYITDFDQKGLEVGFNIKF